MQTSEIGTLKEQGYWQRTCLWLVDTCIWNRLLTIRQWSVVDDANMHAKANPRSRQSAYCSLRNRASRSGIWDKHWFFCSIRLYIKYCTYGCIQTRRACHLETPGKQKHSQYFTLATMIPDTTECTVPLFYKWGKWGPRNRGYQNHKAAMRETCS